LPTKIDDIEIMAGFKVKGRKRKKGEKPPPRVAYEGAVVAGDADADAEVEVEGASSPPPQHGLSGLLRNLFSSMGINRKLENMTMFDILATHPLIRIGKFVFVPYFAYVSVFYLRLHHPEYLSAATCGLMNLRPAIHGTDIPRQVLIVAAPGSGASQMSTEMRSALSLEIGHETTDIAWDYNRDGTISWLRGIRFLTSPTDDGERVRAVAGICNAGIDVHSRMGFHPATFGPSRLNCSHRSSWDECWKSECFLMLLDEWGCGATTKNKCKVNFAKHIHQVRNPMHTLEDLVSTYCIGGLEGVVEGPFLMYASALFPHHDFYGDSCIEATGTFLVSYLEAMTEARHRGDIDSFYKIEGSSACDVAGAAGLSSANTTVYGPNHARIGRLCGDGDDDDDGGGIIGPAARKKIVGKKLSEVDSNRPKLGWNDLLGGMYSSKRVEGDRTLQKRVKNMFVEFAYGEKMIPLQYERTGRGDSHGEL
jgi:hypothetical protein